MFELEPVIFQLSNGIRVVYQKKEAFVAHLGVMIFAGSRFEREEEQGIAHFIEHCIFKGTKKRKAFDIFTDLDSVGGELNAYTNKEEVCVHASFRKTHFSIASELLGDIVQNASFPEDEIQKEKEVVLDEIISYLDSPSERIFDDFEAKLFKKNSLGYNTLGTKKTVKSFTRKALKNYLKRYFIPSNMVISFVGGISIDELRSTLETDFGNFEGDGGTPEFYPLNKIKPFKSRSKKSNFQTHTIIGGVAPSYHSDDRRAMTLLTNVLGGPALNSRLILSVRETYGYAYNIEANYSTYSDIGFWTVYMGTDKKYLDKALKLIYEEFDKICSHKLTDKELIQAKEQLKGHIALSLDNNLELMFSLAKSVMIHNRVDSVSEVYEQIDAINVDEVYNTANKYFNQKQLSELIFEF